MTGMLALIAVLAVLGVLWVGWQVFTTRGGTASDLLHAGAGWAMSSVTPYDDGTYWAWDAELGDWVLQYPPDHHDYPDTAGEGR